MISDRYRGLILAALTVPWSLAAGTDVPALVSSYYQMRLKDKPTGVYEWAEQDLLFVQVRAKEETGDAAEEQDARILVAEHDALFAWLGRQASARRKDVDLGEGYNFLRDLVREHDPLWEYDSEWNYAFNGPHFSRLERGEKVCCAVYRKSDVVATMPQSFLKSAGVDVWERGGESLVKENYVGKMDRPFMWGIGALDVLELSLDAPMSLAAWMKDFGVGEQPRALAEYQMVRTGTDRYLQESELAHWMQTEKRRLETLPDEISYKEYPPVQSPACEVKRTVETNRIDDFAYEVVVREHEVRTQSHRVRKIVTKRAQDPRFEKLFLSGGSLTNQVSATTELGSAAERCFYAKDGKTVAERKSRVVEALRENPGDKVLWNLLARILILEGDEYGAVICLRNALRLDREYGYALTNLAIVYRKLECMRLAYGFAVLAHGVSADAWCRRESTKILRNE